MPNKLKNHAIALLSRRDHSIAELTLKLIQKGYERDAITPTLKELVTTGYLDESRFTENYIRYRRQKGFGPERIALELANKGVPDSIIAVQLDFTDNAWLAEAQRVKNKHFKNQAIKDFKVKAKQMRFLKYKGFTTEQIQFVFSAGATNTNDIDIEQ